METQPANIASKPMLKNLNLVPIKLNVEIHSVEILPKLNHKKLSCNLYDIELDTYSPFSKVSIAKRVKEKEPFCQSYQGRKHDSLGFQAGHPP